jgi:hypothetical protein
MASKFDFICRDCKQPSTVNARWALSCTACRKVRAKTVKRKRSAVLRAARRAAAPPREYSFICVDCNLPSIAKSPLRIRCISCDNCRARLSRNRRSAKRMAAKRANDPEFLAKDRARVRALMKAKRAHSRATPPADQPAEAFGEFARAA